MNQELKEQAHKEFDEKFAWLSAGMPTTVPEIKSFIDSLIDKTVQKTEERIVGIIGEMNTTCCQENETDGDCNCKYEDNPFIRKQDIISLITNKSELSTNKDER